MEEINQNNKKTKAKHSDILRWVIISLIALGGVALIFSAGMFVGSMKTQFSYRWAENYQKNFAGPRSGFLGEWRGWPLPPKDFMESHGSFGEIIEINGNSLVIKGRGDMEKIIIIKPETIIKKGRETIKKESLKAGNYVVVIGAPNQEGQIEAKLIRVFEKPVGRNFLPIF